MSTHFRARSGFRFSKESATATPWQEDTNHLFPFSLAPCLRSFSSRAVTMSVRSATLGTWSDIHSRNRDLGTALPASFVLAEKKKKKTYYISVRGWRHPVASSRVPLYFPRLSSLFHGLGGRRRLWPRACPMSRHVGRLQHSPNCRHSIISAFKNAQDTCP